MLTCTFAAATLGPYALSFTSEQDTARKEGEPFYKALSLMAFIMDVTFAIALALFSFGHFYMVARNQTSIEDSRTAKRFDRGWRENMKTVFGSDPRLWFIPTHSNPLIGDGVHWRLHDGSWDGLPEKELVEDEDA
jgi:hypothetical protein